MVDKDEKEGLQCHLTNAEKAVLEMITSKFYNLKQIQIVRKCSRQAVYKIIKKLKEKGYLNLSLQKVDRFEGTCQPKENQVRLHGQEFNIKILWQDQRYEKLLEKSNILFIEGHTIKLYKNSIEIYASDGAIFYGEDETRADRKSVEYWKRLFPKLEHRLKAVIFKEGSMNIKEVNHHYARGNSEICEKSLEDEGKRIRIYAMEDGKLAFITDESFGGKEDETVHPITAKRDRKAVDKQVNDWRLHNPPTNSELAEVSRNTLNSINSLVEIQKGLPENLALLKEQIASHLKLIQEYRKENIRWRKNTEKDIKKNIGQKSLHEFM